MNKRILNACNVPKKLCKSLLGEKEKPIHRMIIGLLFMAIGVSIAKFCADSGNTFVGFFGDIIGYGIHGTGLVPFIDVLTEIAEVE